MANSKVLGGGIIDGDLGENPVFSEIEAGLGRILTSVIDGYLQYWIVEETEGTDWKLLANGLYANKTTLKDIADTDSFKNRQVIKGILVAQGLSGNYGFFADGFTYTADADIGVSADNKFYKYVGADDYPVVVAAGTDPDIADFEQVVFNQLENISDLDQPSGFDDVNYRDVNKSTAILEDAPLGTRYRLTDMFDAPYQVVSASDAGGWYIAELASGRKLKLNLDSSFLINAKWYGVYGDGVTDNYTAMQRFFDDVFSRKATGWIVEGTYYTSNNLATPSTNRYQNEDTGGSIIGANRNGTILTRNQTSQGQYIQNQSDALAASVISIHGSYFNFSGIGIKDAAVGIYFGRDELETHDTYHTSFNEISDVLINNADLGIVSYSSEGHYYNDYRMIHIRNAHIGVAFFEGDDTPVPSIGNNNRNTFSNIRVSRSIVGWWLKAGGTNNIYSWNNENIKTGQFYNTRPVPFGVPAWVDSGCGFIIEGTAVRNTFNSCKQENNDLLIYNGGTANVFIDALTIQNSDDAQNKVNFVEEPAVYIDVNNFYFRNMGGFLNTSVDGMDIRSGMLTSKSGIRIEAGESDTETTLDIYEDISSALNVTIQSNSSLFRDSSPSEAVAKITAYGDDGNIYSAVVEMQFYRGSSGSIDKASFNVTRNERVTGYNVKDEVDTMTIIAYRESSGDFSYNIQITPPNLVTLNSVKIRKEVTQ